MALDWTHLYTPAVLMSMYLRKTELMPDLDSFPVESGPWSGGWCQAIRDQKKGEREREREATNRMNRYVCVNQ